MILSLIDRIFFFLLCYASMLSNYLLQRQIRVSTDIVQAVDAKGQLFTSLKAEVLRIESWNLNSIFLVCCSINIIIRLAVGRERPQDRQARLSIFNNENEISHIWPRPWSSNTVDLHIWFEVQSRAEVSAGDINCTTNTTTTTAAAAVTGHIRERGWIEV